MEFRICLNTENTYRINDEMDFEEMDGRAYFFIHSTDKVIVMDEPSYTLWRCIMQCAEQNQSVTLPLLRAFFEQEYIFNEEGRAAFPQDMAKTIHFLAQEDFLQDVL